MGISAWPLVLAVAACLTLSACAHSGGPEVPAWPPIGDYDAEPRRPDGHVDSERLVRQLQLLHANTYFWLIWHADTDWEDLHEFLPLARAAGINVWVYLVPHTESTPPYPYSEPFKQDYVRWAQEIAKLSLEHDNLPGYVIDDFVANISPGRFTAEYIKQMVDAGKAINPKLKFYPLLYFPEIDNRLMAILGPLVDGAVAAYPLGRSQIERALTFLNDEYTVPPGLVVEFPRSTPSQPGDRGFVTQEAQVTDAANARVHFRYQDDYEGPTTGYHVMQMRLDGRVVWAEDAGGRDQGEVTVDLREALAGKQSVRLSFGVYDEKGVSEYGLVANFSDLRVEGLKLAQPDFSDNPSWHQDIEGAFTLAFVTGDQGQRRWKLPLIIMPCGSRGEYVGRYTDEPTPTNIASRIRMSLGFVERGEAEGVVIYCLDKNETGPDLEAISTTYRAFWYRMEQARASGMAPAE